MAKRILAFMTVLAVFMLLVPIASARHKNDKNEPVKILYVPHDNRPISDKQTAAVVAKLGYEVIVPPDEILGDRQNLGQPEKIWSWLEQNVPQAQAAVISADSMLYGSLVGSRKHEYSEQAVAARIAKFSTLHKNNPKLPLYVFGSIMRTPKNSEASGHEEPAYYRSYGADIFRYTVLEDKAEVEGLSMREQKEMDFLQELIPENDLGDWLGRREKNFRANEKLIKLTQDNVFSYLVLGRDDNAPYSRTHLESRHLASSGSSMDKNKFQAMAGIDETGLLLLTRAVNTLQNATPKVFIRYNWGRGEYTVPTYSDEKISDSLTSAIIAAKAEPVKRPAGADLVLTVNTNPNGKTYEASARSNNIKAREGTKYFADIVSEYLANGYPVGIADIAYANGADNALLEELRKRQLLFKLKCYAGWNTATNSTGFALAEGLLASRMSAESVDDLLLTRYLDDWCYQANVRNTIARQLTWLRGDGVYGSLDSKKDAVAQRSIKMIRQFVQDNLPPLKTLEEIDITFPWNRLFEADILHQEYQEINYFKRK